MRIPQLSLTIANQPGHLIAPCKLLADAGINILTLSLADQHEVGIMRIIVRDSHRACQVLEAAGLPVTVSDVLADRGPRPARRTGRAVADLRARGHQRGVDVRLYGPAWAIAR